MKKKRIGLEFRSLNHVIRRYFENSAIRKQIVSITGTNGWIIGYLSENADKNIFQKDLEKEFSITRSTASKILQLMERKGLIERHSVARDARLKKLTLTPKAWAISELMKKNADQMEETLVKGFTDEEIEKLHLYIQRMISNLT